MLLFYVINFVIQTISGDFLYYDNLIKETKYSVNEMEIKEYFPLDVVVDGTLQIYQELLGLRFEKVHAHIHTCAHTHTRTNIRTCTRAHKYTHIHTRA